MKRSISALLLCLLLAGCTVGIVNREILTPAPITQTPASVTAHTPQPTATLLASATPSPMPSPAQPPATLQPSPSPQPVAPVVTSTPVQVSIPDRAVQRVWVSPAWPRDRTLFGLWRHAATRGQLYFSSDGGSTWEQPQLELEGVFSTLAISPGYAEDRMVLVGVAGMGVLESNDGGRSLQPVHANLSGMYASQILFSPGFERDGTVFALLFETLYHSTDGAASWQSLDVALNHVALSPEFDQDQTLMGISARGNKVMLSQDGGNTWEHVGDLPDDGTLDGRMISIAPLFSRWQVVFAYSENILYHSVDGGRNWDAVLVLSPPSPDYFVPRPQLVYGPETDAGRVLFLQATINNHRTDPITIQNVLYYSKDALNWQTLELPADISPTAIAISPDFAQDGLLFVGNNDGRIVALDTATLIGE